MLRVAIVGCGKIADAHASQILRVKGCEIVGVCDQEPLMARQLCERFPVKGCFSDVTELLSQARPDVVHITTSPESHFDIAGTCMQHGCHVLVEKPFALDAKQTEALLALALRKGLKLTVDHNYQFTHAARRLRALVEGGYLGGAPVHMESCYGYDLGDPRYARVLLCDQKHWVRRLPGKLLHNIISHGIARIAEFLTSDDPQVIAYGFASPLLKGVDETELIDELRVIISERERLTAYFTFSSQMRPVVNEFRLYGPKNGVVLDHNHEVVLRLRGAKFKSYADNFIPPVLFARQYLGNLLGNVRLFLSNDFHMDSGMKYLFEAFYRAVRNEGPVPIPYREILLTARIMDTIFDQLSRGRGNGEETAAQDLLSSATLQPLQTTAVTS